jgi:hypothetical protein
MTTKNPILDELHSIRERLLADAGGTLDDLVDRLQTEEQQSDRPSYQAGRTVGDAAAAKAGEPPVELPSTKSDDR